MNIDKIILNLERILDLKIGKAIHLKNEYGTNQQLFKLVTKNKKFYFLKFCKGNSLYEAEGYENLKKYLPVSRLLFSGYIEGQAILLYDYILGDLLTDVLLKEEGSNQESSFMKVENKKNKLLADMYNETSQEISLENYLNCVTCSLYYGRLFGDRFKEYYLNKESSLNLNLRKDIVLNGVNFGNCLDVINSIKSKYENAYYKKLHAIQGHGDAHHQNIIVNSDGGIHFTDFEYVGTIPIAMEISKPYYIDLIGTLFFFFEERLLEHFSFENICESQNSVDLKINIKSLPEIRLKITENKISYFKNLLLDSKDILTLNDYLVLSHLLSRNPNNYSHSTQSLFLIFLILFAKFNPLEPRSLFKFFN